MPAEIDGQVHIPGAVRLEQADTAAGSILQQGDRTGLVLGVYHSLHGVRQGGVGVTGRFGHQVQLMTLPGVGGTVVEQGGGGGVQCAAVVLRPCDGIEGAGAAVLFRYVDGVAGQPDAADFHLVGLGVSHDGRCHEVGGDAAV